MSVNLFLKFDDDLRAAVLADARAAGRTFEEEVRKRLTEGAGLVYEPLTAADIVADDAPHLMFDLTRRGRG
jgi:hypothetical protein